jgi:F-type H+-transporting ATPase subunit b
VQVNLLDIVFALLNFLILLGILQLVLYKPVVRLLNEREERVKRQNQELEANRQKLAALEEELERKQTELAAQVRQILDDARHQGQKTKEEILAQAREEARHILSRAEAEVQRERLRAWEELWGEMVNLVISAATRIVGEDFNDDKHRRRIEEFISSLDLRQIGELTNENG